jgi:hypothetical protein
MNSNPVPSYPSYPPYGQPMQRDSSLAIVSLVMGIAGLIILPFICSIVAVITGHNAMNEIKKSNGMIKGQGMATAGMVMGYIGIGFFVLGVIVIVVLTLLGPAIGNVFSSVNSSLY